MTETSVVQLIERQDATRRLTVNPWVSYLARRARRLVVSLFVLITASFLMLQLIPGDPVRSALGPTADPALVTALREQLGLNDPLHIQYLNYLGGLFTGDLGVSIITRVPVATIIEERLPATLQIALLAYVVAFAIGIPLGVLMARVTRNNRRPRTEGLFNGAGITIATMPDFIIAILLVAVFSVTLGWLPVAGRSGADSFIIPVLALALGAVFVVARLIRLDVLRVLGLDYIRAAQAKRLSVFRTYVRHALPNALTATLTVAGLSLGGMLAGTVLVETVLAWPGMGSMMVEGITSKNYPVVQGIILVYGIMILAINVVVDIAIALLDPRVAVAGGKQ